MTQIPANKVNEVGPRQGGMQSRRGTAWKSHRQGVAMLYMLLGIVCTLPVGILLRICVTRVLTPEEVGMDGRDDAFNLSCPTA